MSLSYYIIHSNPHTKFETIQEGVEELGRDEHNHAKGKNFLAQTPKNQISDGKDVEFAEEFADNKDKEAQARSRAADKRMKRK